MTTAVNEQETNLYLADLQSKRSPLVKKAAKKILKERLKGYGPALHESLEIEIEKPRAWETQMYLIYAIAATECIDEVAYLKKLIQRDYEATILYRTLALAIVYLEIMEKQDLSFLYESFVAKNVSFVRGGCAAIYMTKMILKDEDFNKIMSYITQPKYNEHFGKIISPFMYILAASYLYSEKNRAEILSFSEQFDNQLVREIISDVKRGKDGKRINFF